jgi:hypothetical protein
MSTHRVGDEPYRHYWHVLYPEYADNARAHWLPKFQNPFDVHGTLWRKAAGPARVDPYWPTPRARGIPRDRGCHAPRIARADVDREGLPQLPLGFAEPRRGAPGDRRGWLRPIVRAGGAASGFWFEAKYRSDNLIQVVLGRRLFDDDCGRFAEVIGEGQWPPRQKPSSRVPLCNSPRARTTTGVGTSTRSNFCSGCNPA